MVRIESVQVANVTIIGRPSPSPTNRPHAALGASPRSSNANEGGLTNGNQIPTPSLHFMPRTPSCGAHFTSGAVRSCRDQDILHGRLPGTAKGHSQVRRLGLSACMETSRSTPAIIRSSTSKTAKPNRPPLRCSSVTIGRSWTITRRRCLRHRGGQVAHPGDNI
jgi:hypothetical protein